MTNQIKTIQLYIRVVRFIVFILQYFRNQTTSCKLLLHIFLCHLFKWRIWNREVKVGGCSCMKKNWLKTWVQCYTATIRFINCLIFSGDFLRFFSQWLSCSTIRYSSFPYQLIVGPRWFLSYFHSIDVFYASGSQLLLEIASHN